MDPLQYAKFKRSLRETLRLLDEEIGGERSVSRLEALRSIQRELAALDAADHGPVDSSGAPGRRSLRSHRSIVQWPDDDPVKRAVLEVEQLHLERLP